MFGLAFRRAIEALRQTGAAIEIAIDLILSYLDGMAFGVDAPHMAYMTLVVTDALHNVSLSLNMDNTIAIIPSGVDITCCPRLHTVAIHNKHQRGRATCGQPFSNLI